MGDPKKPRKKYETPIHPWSKERIEVEKELITKYGLKNKKEIMKMNSVLSNMKDQAKKYIAATGKQAEIEKKQLLNRIQRLALVEKLTDLDDVLGLGIEAIMERRLQTMVVRRGLARTMRQARQFITHDHICVGEKVVSSPSYLISKNEEPKISFIARSTINNPEHPERQNEKTKRK